MGITRQVQVVRHPLRWAVIGMPWTATAMDPDGAWGSETNDLPPLTGAWMMMDNVMKPVYVYIYIYVLLLLYIYYIMYIYYILIYKDIYYLYTHHMRFTRYSVWICVDKSIGLEFLLGWPCSARTD